MSQQQANRSGTSPGVDEFDEAPRRSTSLAGFLLPVILVAGLGAAGLFLYKQRVEVKAEVGELVTKARDKIKKHDLASLKEAEGLHNQILEMDASNDRALSSLALIYYYEWQHGLPTRDKADQFAAQAVAENAERPERYASVAYLAIARGEAAKAERELRELLDRDIASPLMAHALGVAQMEQGHYLEANRIISSAHEADFSAVTYQLTLAEIAMRQGEERAAVKNLREVIRDSMSPNHAWARAWLAALSLKNYGNITQPAQNIQLVAESKDKGPVAEGYQSWAEGELSLAAGNADGAIEKAAEARTKLGEFPYSYDLEARALRAKKKTKEAIAAYEKAIGLTPGYRGIKWALAQLKSEQKDNGALAIVDDLEKTVQGTKGPSYEIFRGEHALRMGKLKDAEAHFTKAAELGDDPMILYGFAKLAFEEEKEKGNKADIERVGEAIQLALERRSTFPEVHEFLGEVSLWNFLVPGANSSYEEAEKQYKRLRRPIPEIIAFYDRVADAFDDVKEKKLKKEASQFEKQWRAKKSEYLASLVTEQ